MAVTTTASRTRPRPSRPRRHRPASRHPGLAHRRRRGPAYSGDPGPDAAASGQPAAGGAAQASDRCAGAKQVVEAFRAAGLKVPRPKDRSVDCGPDGLGLGCSELMATGAVTVYVFPDETSARDIAETWGGQSYQRGAVVLNYLEAKTPAADRPRYEKVLDGLR
ncbi:hypothetical protein NKG94_24870 [Micromonospora sp. M12]